MTVMVTGWQRKLHIFEVPFYYVEYGLASLGAFQVWRNAMKDQSAAVEAYRRALALGGTVPLPKLYETAGAQLRHGCQDVAGGRQPGGGDDREAGEGVGCHYESVFYGALPD